MTPRLLVLVLVAWAGVAPACQNAGELCAVGVPATDPRACCDGPAACTARLGQSSLCVAGASTTTTTVTPGTSTTTTLVPTKPANGNAATVPRRPTTRDISLKKEHQGIQPYAYWGDKVATQVNRFAMQDARSAIWIYQVLVYARDAGFTSLIGSTIGQLNKLFTQYIPIYQNRPTVEGCGKWPVDVDGTRYFFEAKESQKYADASAGGGGSRCAASPYMTTQLADYLDLRIEGGRCVRGALFTIPTPTEAWSAVRGEVGVIDTCRTFTLSPRIRAAIHVSMDAHAAASGFGASGSTLGVDGSHLALESLCAAELGETGHALCAISRFGGVPDPTWATAELDVIHHLEHLAHHRWGTCLLGQAPDFEAEWPCAFEAMGDHQMYHALRQFKHPDARYRVSCVDEHGTHRPIQDCPKVSQADLLRDGVAHELRRVTPGDVLEAGR